MMNAEGNVDAESAGNKEPTVPSSTEVLDSSDAGETEKFFDPTTGEQISKNAFKKLSKAPKKEKKEKVAPVAKSAADKKEKKVKEPEEVWLDSTPAGKKKNIEGVFPTTYQPKYVEAAWQAWWEKEGYYTPNLQKALQTAQDDKFVMVIPPPNVTGSLHLGHALTTAVEDTLTRWHRMKGKIVLWVPGTDHAGIATQSVVEKRLKKDEGITRHDLGREEFMKRVWQWKEMYGNKITNQIRCLGASVDWSRESFTMDANLSRAVTEAFCRFHEKGLLYRDTRLINWSCALQSAISEIEVDYIDLEGRTFLPVPNHKDKATYEFGMITSFAYKVYNEADSKSDEEIVVATTRLETMLGDSAVAVHPDDPRYTHLHGKFLIHPFLDRKIPIITDSTLVDMSFGTGAVKVTPAHDPNDYLCGKRNNLEFIIMLTEDGKVNNNGGQFTGLMRYDARIEMEKELEKLGHLRGKEVNKMRLGLCSRSGDIIEPMLTPQWYVNCNSMAKKATDAVRNGELKIFPEFHEGDKSSNAYLSLSVFLYLSHKLSFFLSFIALYCIFCNMMHHTFYILQYFLTPLLTDSYLSDASNRISRFHSISIIPIPSFSSNSTQPHLSNRLQRHGSAGWKTSETGVCLANCGGATVSLPTSLSSARERSSIRTTLPTTTGGS